MKVWRVQDTNNAVGKAGAVSPGIKASYPGEAEVISLGYAPGKAYDSVGIGRHGNFLQWGWSASPSKMTPAGQALLLNCICYMKQFGGKPFVKIPQKSMGRDSINEMFGVMKTYPETVKDYPPRYFQPEIVEKFKTDIEGMQKYYEENTELIYVKERKFYVDADLVLLGLDSNRKVETIEKLVALLAEQAKAKLARQLLVKYTQENFETPEKWSGWFKKNKERLFFSDEGGYKFYVVPK